MKKFYSLVLMAAALLISTSMSAKVLQGNTGADLQDAIYAIMSGTESDNLIQLSQNVDLTRTVWVGTKDIDGAYKSITIDLNGKNITWNSSTSAKHEMFVLTHGELKVINTGANEAKVQLTGLHANNSRCFVVYGSYKSSRWNDAGDALSANPINTRAENGGWFSHLEIGTNVLLYAGQGSYAEGIAVDRLADSQPFYKNSSEQVTLTYGGQLFKATYGFAQGVRVDFKGKMDIVGGASGKVYGFSVKGNVASSLTLEQNGKHKITDKSSYGTYASNYYSFNDSIHLRQDGKTHRLDTLDAPFIYVHPGAEIKVREDGDKVAAIYAAGYAKWLVQGYAEGKTGMYASSGAIDLEDAYVKSSADTWTHPEGIGSANGGGSGVVLNSRDAYAGGIEFVVSGDTKIESVGGYAIEEAVNTTVVVPNPEHATNPEAPETIPASNVSNITINGGTIEGGEKGAIIISGPTDAATKAIDENAKSTVVVYGGNVEGTTTVGADGDMDDIIATGTHTTEITVTDPEDPTKTKTVVVVSEGDAPDEPAPGQGNSVIAQADSAAIKWVQPDASLREEILNKDLILKELEINEDYAQKLTIASGKTLSVGRVVLGENAQIVVEAGAKFIVYGEQGIVAPKASNIVLKNEEGNRSIFLFNPKVTSNKHPNATFEILSHSWRVSATEVQSEVFGIPTYNAVKSVACLDAGKYGYIQVYDKNGNWENIAFTDDDPFPYAKLNKPFAAYALTAYRTQREDKLTFQFGGELVGNTDASLNANLKWSFFANSYTAEVDLAAFLAGLETSAQYVDKAIYVSGLNGGGYWSWEALDADALKEDGNPTKLQPMQGFLLNNKGFVEANAINYETMVYAPAVPNYKPSQAPRRNVVANNNTAKLYVVVTNEAGAYDNVKLRETENTKSIEKYMNADVNIYASGDEKSAILAAEDLANTYVGFSTVNGGNFTISFTNVAGREFTLVDHETGAHVAIVEGNTYEFTAAANSVNDYRFEIVESAKLPTAIENTEAVKSAKGIYTITGQFVGEMNVWNTLPAGIYVVNGEKRVK